MKINQTSAAHAAKGFLEAPPVEWKSRLEEWKRNEPAEAIAETVRHLEAEIERMTRLRGYLEWRALPDLGHAAAVDRANKLVTAVRKALGFAYPSRGTFDF